MTLYVDVGDSIDVMSDVQLNFTYTSLTEDVRRMEM